VRESAISSSYPAFVSNLVYGWESPYWCEVYERLARSFRLILFDKRGTGLSDRGGAGWAALETRMETCAAFSRRTRPSRGTRW
jgi:pimeloyl-ACP methyl ester carboxylesterase